MGSPSWLAKESRPDLACAANFAQSRQGNPTLQDVKDTSKTIKQANNYKDHGMQIKPVPLGELCVVVYHDTAWGASQRTRPWRTSSAVGSAPRSCWQ